MPRNVRAAPVLHIDAAKHGALAGDRMVKRERFVTPVTCPECALNGLATWEERGDLETTIECISEGFRDGPAGEIFCAACGVKAIMGKTLSRSEMNDPAPR
jgi:Zn ribbon nucleic-acid-binding protein